MLEFVKIVWGLTFKVCVPKVLTEGSVMEHHFSKFTFLRWECFIFKYDSDKLVLTRFKIVDKNSS